MPNERLEGRDLRAEDQPEGSDDQKGDGRKGA